MMHLSDFRDFLKGEHVVVCGTGPSWTNHVSVRRLIEHRWTIGVNDCQSNHKHNHPQFGDILATRTDFLCCFEAPGQPIWEIVRRHSSFAVFNCESDSRFKGVRRFARCPLISEGKGIEVGLDTPDAIGGYGMSPFLAVGIAYKMGAKRIGLIGVDIEGHWFFDQPGQVEPAVLKWAELHKALEERGVELVNLSTVGLLTIPRADWGTMKERGAL